MTYAQLTRNLSSIAKFLVKFYRNLGIMAILNSTQLDHSTKKHAKFLAKLLFTDRQSDRQTDNKGTSTTSGADIIYQSISYLCGFVAESIVFPRRSLASSRAACSMRWLSAARSSRCARLTVGVDRGLTSLDALCDLAVLGGHLQYSLSLFFTRYFQTATTQHAATPSRCWHHHSVVMRPSLGGRITRYTRRSVHLSTVSCLCRCAV